MSPYFMETKKIVIMVILFYALLGTKMVHSITCTKCNGTSLTCDSFDFSVTDGGKSEYCGYYKYKLEANYWYCTCNPKYVCVSYIVGPYNWDIMDYIEGSGSCEEKNGDSWVTGSWYVYLQAKSEVSYRNPGFRKKWEDGTDSCGCFNCIQVPALNDSDNDGIDDTCDNCPNVYNPEQPDADNDDIGDECDTENCSDGIDNNGYCGLVDLQGMGQGYCGDTFVTGTPVIDECFKCNEEGQPINTYSGEMHHAIDLYSSNLPGPDLELSVTYRSRKKHDNPFGWGWYNNYDYELDVDVASSATLQKSSGESMHFQFEAATSIYKEGKGGTSFIQSCNTDYYCWYKTDGYVYHFYASGTNEGLLYRIEDEKGKYLNFSYDAGNLSKVSSDITGSSISFDYPSNFVTNVTVPGDKVFTFNRNAETKNLDSIDIPDDSSYPSSLSYDMNYTDTTGCGESLTSGYDTHNLTVLSIPIDSSSSRDVCWSYDYNDRATFSSLGDDIEGVEIQYESAASIGGSMSNKVKYSYDGSEKTSYDFSREGTDNDTMVSGGCSSCGVSDRVKRKYDSEGRIIERIDLDSPSSLTTTWSYGSACNGKFDSVRIAQEVDTTPASSVITISYYFEDTKILAAETKSSLEGANSVFSIYDYDPPNTATSPFTGSNICDFNQYVSVPELLRTTIKKGYEDSDGDGNSDDYVTIATKRIYNASNLLEKEYRPVSSSSLWPPDQNNVGYTEYTYYNSGNKNQQLQKMEEFDRGGSSIYSTTYDYDASGNVTSVTDANGNTTTYSYNLMGKIKSSTTGSITTSYYYDGQGRLQYVENPRDDYTDYKYDEAGRMIGTTHTTETLSFSQMDATIGHTNKQLMDERGRITKSFSLTGPDDVYTSAKRYEGYAYDITTIDGVTYDRKKIYHTTDHSDTPAAEYTDGEGNLVGRLNENSKLTWYTYDDNGRLTSVITYDGPDDTYSKVQQTDYQYNENNDLTRVVSHVDFGANANTIATAYKYDDFGRLIEVNSPDTGITRYSYNADGSVKKNN